MQDFDALQKDLHKKGKLNTLKALAESRDAAAVNAAVDSGAVQKAVQGRDSAALQAVLSQVLSTEEGKRLAAKVKEAMKDG